MKYILFDIDNFWHISQVKWWVALQVKNGISKDQNITGIWIFKHKPHSSLSLKMIYMRKNEDSSEGHYLKNWSHKFHRGLFKI